MSACAVVVVVKGPRVESRGPTKANSQHVAVGLAWLLAGWQLKVNKQNATAQLGGGGV